MWRWQIGIRVVISTAVGRMFVVGVRIMYTCTYMHSNYCYCCDCCSQSAVARQFVSYQLCRARYPCNGLESHYGFPF